jgi:hypothetical protein
LFSYYGVLTGEIAGNQVLKCKIYFPGPFVAIILSAIAVTMQMITIPATKDNLVYLVLQTYKQLESLIGGFIKQQEWYREM